MCVCVSDAIVCVSEHDQRDSLPDAGNMNEGLDVIVVSFFYRR